MWASSSDDKGAILGVAWSVFAVIVAISLWVKK
jgi:hypothetical protein